ACAHAMTAAADAGRPLLVLAGGIEPGRDAVGVLLAAFDDDPMIGFASPRLSGADLRGVAPLDDGGDRMLHELPRRLLSELPASYLVADAPARCLLIKAEVLANVGRLDSRFHTLAGALWDYIGCARRCGFRTLVCNQAVVVDASGNARRRTSTARLADLPRRDLILLRELLPDVERAHEEFGTPPVALAEARLARALPLAYGTRPSLLVDMRHCGRTMDRTAAAAPPIARR